MNEKRKKITALIHCALFNYEVACHDRWSWNSISIIYGIDQSHHTLQELLGCWFWSAPLTDYRTQESRRPSCMSDILIVGANLQAAALPEVDSIFRTSTVAVTYLVTNSVWHEARWEMEGRRTLLICQWNVSPNPSIWLQKKRRTDKRSVTTHYRRCM